MQFTPKKESELSKGFEPLPAGDYPFTVLESEEVASKSQKNSGKIMVKLKLAIHTKDGRDQWVWDYFADWFSEWKLKHFADATGHSADYESGKLDFKRNSVGQWTGHVKLAIEADDDGKKRNVVEDYIPETDDVPF